MRRLSNLFLFVKVTGTLNFIEGGIFSILRSPSGARLRSAPADRDTWRLFCRNNENCHYNKSGLLRLQNVLVYRDIVCVDAEQKAASGLMTVNRSGAQSINT